MKLDITIFFHSLGTLFGKEIPIYGVCYMIGLAVGALLAFWAAKKRSFDGWEVVYSGVFIGVGGIIGAKALSILTSLDVIIPYLKNGGSIVEVIKNGFVFYGGFIGAAIGLFIYTKAYRLSFASYADLFAVGVPLGHAIGRVGCLFGGCCYGMEVPDDFPLTLTYHFGDPDYIAGVVDGRHYLPIQFIETLCLLVIFAVGLILFRRLETNGINTVFYIGAYSVVRFVLEFFRGDAERGIYGVFSTSQWISLGLFVLSFAGFIILLIKKKRENKHLPPCAI